MGGREKIVLHCGTVMRNRSNKDQWRSTDGQEMAERGRDDSYAVTPESDGSYSFLFEKNKQQFVDHF